MLYVIATLIVKPEKRGDFLENARVMIAATRREAGCERYDLTSSITEPNEFVFVEKWASREALQGHFDSQHMATWRKISNECLDRRTVEIIDPTNVEIR